VKREVIYFDSAGPANTGACLEITRAALSGGYKHLVVASTSGATGLLFARELAGGKADIVVVAHAAGFRGPGVVEFNPGRAREIAERGARVCQGTMPFHSLENAVEKQFSGTLPISLVAHTLRLFGQGVKVGCEIVMMAVDAGLVPEEEEVIAVAGSRSGADTVLVIYSASSRRFLELKVLEIIAKPRQW
jgi:hypothetical protein